PLHQRRAIKPPRRPEIHRREPHHRRPRLALHDPRMTLRPRRLDHPRPTLTKPHRQVLHPQLGRLVHMPISRNRLVQHGRSSHLRRRATDPEPTTESRARDSPLSLFPPRFVLTLYCHGVEPEFSRLLVELAADGMLTVAMNRPPVNAVD